MTRKVEIIDKRKFAIVALNTDDDIFMVHIATLAELMTISIHSFYQAQVVLLTSKENGIFAEYSNFSNIFFVDSTAELVKYIGINDLPINLLDNDQLLYSPIYSLELVKLKMFKTYIEANLTSSFIRSLKFSIGTLIPFV